MLVDQQNWVKAANESDFLMDGLNLMTMNMGGNDTAIDAQTAIKGGSDQLKKIYGDKIKSPMDRMGMIPAIGIDDTRQVLDLKGAKTSELG